MSDKTGGAAFPNDKFMDDGTILSTPGMTLRDYFAAKAMQGMIASGDFDKRVRFVKTEDLYPQCAGSAYSMAEAMLVERAK